MTLDQWRVSLDDILPEIIALRRELHMHPELGGAEEQTRALIVRAMQKTQAELSFFDDCFGVMAILRNGDGPCIAIRADMDALPLDEKAKSECCSCVPGVMHACGHDVHMALAIGTAYWLDRNHDQWHGTVKLLFEPAEETFGGSQLMVAQGCLNHPKVDCVIGQHVNPHYAAGAFFSMPGYVSGSSDKLVLTVNGKRSHGAYPEGGVDAIVIAAQVVTALQSLVSRSISPFEPAVITFGTVNGGTANNIICDQVTLVGTLRTLSADTRAFLRSRITETAEGIASAMGGSANVEIEAGYGAVYNHDVYHQLAESCARALVGDDLVIRRKQASLGVESFCYFVQDTPGVFYDLGCGVGTALHTDTFQINEACLLPGIAMQCETALAIMKEVRNS